MLCSKLYRVDQLLTRERRAKIWDESTCSYVYATFPGRIARYSSPYDTLATFEPGSRVHMNGEQADTKVCAPMFRDQRYEWVENIDASNSIIAEVWRRSGLSVRTSGYVRVFDDKQEMHDFCVVVGFHKLEYDHIWSGKSLFLVKVIEPPPDPRPVTPLEPRPVTPLEPCPAAPPQSHPGTPHGSGTYLFHLI